MNYWNVQELACAILGLDYDDLVDNGKEDEIDDTLYNKYEISMEQFMDIAGALLEFTPPIQGGLAKAWYNAFGIEEDGIWRAIVKKEIKKKEE